MSESEKKHGGARAGAGRKTKYEKTTVMRVPEKYKDAISALISYLDETKHINNHDPQGSQSDPVFLRSLDDNAQNIVFTTKPI